MTLSYDVIFSDFLGNINDVEFASLEASDAYEMMSEYLQKGVANTYVRRLFDNPQLDKEIQVFTFEMSNPTNDDADLDFTRNILAKSMVVEWLKPQVRSKNITAQMIASSDKKFFSQSQHLKELRSLLEDTELELRKEIRDRGYVYNQYLG